MIAIVIPYYNYHFFEKTLESLASQTDKRFKVYIGDDCSPDDPTVILRKFQGRFSFLFHKFEENLGSNTLVKQWERCIELIGEEEWIMVLGDDDILEPICIAKFYENLSEIKFQECQVIRYASQYIDQDEVPLKNHKPYYHPKIENATDAFFRNFSGQSRSSLSEHVFSREAFNKKHFYDYPLAWHSDDRAWLEFSQFGKIFTINEAIVSVRVSDLSITGKKNNIDLKKEAKLQFFEFLITVVLSNFSQKQQESILLEYGVVLKSQGKLTLQKTHFIIGYLLKIRAWVSCIKMWRRFFRFKFLNK
jgi:glycosyltransferase involved in cell wall biosynthesis